MFGPQPELGTREYLLGARELPLGARENLSYSRETYLLRTTSDFAPEFL